MIRLKVIVLLTLFLITYGFAGTNSKTDSTIFTIIDEIYAHNYEKALLISDTIIRDQKEEPIGYYFKSLVYWRRLLDTDLLEDSLASEFKYLIDKTIAASDRKLKFNKQDSRASFYRAAAFGYLGMYYLKRSKILKAYTNGSKGFKLLEETMAMDLEPSLANDACFGLGLYDYYTASIPKFFRVLLLIARMGDEERGIQRLETAASQGKFAKFEARYFLVNVYLENKQYEKAEKLTLELCNQYPENATFHRLKGDVYRRLENWHEAVKAYETMFKTSTDKQLKINEYSYNKKMYYFGYALRKAVKLDQARAVLSQLLQANPKRPDWIASYSHLELGKVYDLLSERENAIAEYKAVLDLKNQGENHNSARSYLERRFTKE